jgi:SulP family sulfate permease
MIERIVRFLARRELVALWRHEFAGYGPAGFRRDALAGMTVAAVALPLALAFGVASGATAAAGLVTAVVAGLAMSALSGAPYQIAGPTGAMSAILIALSLRYGPEGVWVAGVIAGAIMLAIGLLRLGRFISFIPSAAIAGFTSGIALIIAIGQIDPLLGVTGPPSESPALKIAEYITGPVQIDGHAVFLGLAVAGLMAMWPKAWGEKVPAALLGIVLATAIVSALGWQVPQIGNVPRSIVLDKRLSLALIPWGDLRALILPAVAIAALGSVESLLCGAVASNATGVRLHANQELVAQGVGNILIPFFGGVPATAAIARTSVGIRAGGRTRVVGLMHALVLLASVLLVAPVIAKVPQAALAGVLLVTAWRMNDWEMIHYIAGHRFKTAAAVFTITLLATVVLDLTQAILIGVAASAVVFVAQISQIEVTIAPVDPSRLAVRRDIAFDARCDHIRVGYLTGPLFFAAVSNFNESFTDLADCRVLILSMRAVPLADVSGVQAMEHLHERLTERGATLMLAGANARVLRMLERGGVLARIGDENVFWNAEQAILEADARPCPLCENAA